MLQREHVAGHSSDESVVGASVRVVEAGVRLFADRVDLARLEVTEAFAEGATQIGYAASALVTALLAWLLLVGALVFALYEAGVSPAWGLFLGGVASGLLAFGITARGAKRRKGPEAPPSDEGRTRS